MVDVARARKLAVRIKEIVATTLETQVKDPRLGLVTVTDVRVTPDLREATVYYTVYGDEQARRGTALALQSANGVLRAQVGRQTGVKFTPSLAFVADAVPTGAAHLEAVLAQARAADEEISRARAGASPAGEPDPYRHPAREPGDLDAGADHPVEVGAPSSLQPSVSEPAPTVTEADWQAAVAAIMAADEIALACHVNPDGDALGSLLATALALRTLGKRVVASWGSRPFAVPTAYAALPGQQLLSDPEHFPPAPPLLVTFDTGSADRLGLLAPVVAAADCVLVVDHHASNTEYGDLHLLDPAAPATAVLVEELLTRLGVPLTAELAAPLYAALSTDTGSFRFAATTARTHELAARLLATGIRHDLLARDIWDTNSLGYLRLLGAALSRAVLEPAEGDALGLVWTYTTPEDLLANGVGFEVVEGIIAVLRTTAEAEVAVVCKADLDGTIKVSTRSKGHIDMGAVCAELGGGGHRFAAGFTSPDDVPTTMDRLRALLAKAPLLPG